MVVDEAVLDVGKAVFVVDKIVLGVKINLFSVKRGAVGHERGLGAG